MGKTIGERIKERRLELRLTQCEVASKAKITYQTVLNAEKGGKITVSTLQSICNALEINIELLNN